MPQKKQNESSEVKHDKERVLFTWLGYADCYAAITSRQNANQITPEEASRLQELIPYDPVEKYKKHGKLRLLLNEFPFSEIHVLSDLNEELGKEYQQWIQNDFPNFRIHRVPLENVSDYAEVYRVTKDAISAFKSDDSNQEKDLAYYVNPGTTAMGTTWTLLSKSAFPATLYQLSGSSAKPEIVDL
ncbi:hypothetical protein OAM49_00610, partial [bacterium]|nr:hypothetical protein [bacterium]